MEFEQTIQRNADTMRLLKIGLRTHDPETVNAAYERISNTYGEDLANSVVSQTITNLMSSENWSFFNENDEPSPLL